MDIVDRRQLIGDRRHNLAATVTHPAHHGAAGGIEKAIAIGIDDPATLCLHGGPQTGPTMKDRARHGPQPNLPADLSADLPAPAGAYR